MMKYEASEKNAVSETKMMCLAILSTAASIKKPHLIANFSPNSLAEKSEH
jgi:hypothetical protein